MTVFEYHHAGNSEAQQKAAVAYLLAQSSAGRATTGVLSGLAVSQETTASKNVSVAAGAGVAQASVLAGASMLVSDTATVLDVLNANPMGGLPRNDMVVLDGATRSLRVIVGTPNAVPTDPTVPATAVPLARIRNAASAATVPSSAIDDLRTFTSLATNDTGWLALATGGFSGTIVDPVKYRRLNGVVYMQGNVRSFPSGSFQTLGTLPAGFRPAVSTNIGVSSNSGFNMVITVAPSGVVTLWCEATTSAYTGLANVVFPVG